jgi:aspartate/methionine/tyrosine aminotransferase
LSTLNPECFQLRRLHASLSSNSPLILERNRKIISDNLRLFDELAGRHPGLFDWHRPVAGPVAFPAFNADRPIDEIARELIEQKGVMLLPASQFEIKTNHFRLGLGRAALNEALQRLEEYLTEARLS